MKREANNEHWKKMYREFDYGNRYPSSYLVSLYHREIKLLLPKEDRGKKIKAFDFGCSKGANTRMLYDAGCEVYGMDISEKAIEYCISAFQNLDDGGGSYFKATDILKENPFENIAFDFIMASGVLLCFSDEDIGKLLQIFWDMLKEDGIFYANMPTFRHLDYCEYKNAKKENGMVEVKKLGTIDENFYMNIREDKKDVENLFQKFKKVAVYQTEEEYADGICEMIHFIGKK